MREGEIKTWKMTPEETKEYWKLPTEKEKVEFITKIKANPDRSVKKEEVEEKAPVDKTVVP